MRLPHLLWTPFLLAFLLSAFFACSTDAPTGIEVKVDSDYAEQEIESIFVEVTWPGTGASAKRLRCGGAHPFSFGINSAAGRPDVPAHVVLRAYGPGNVHLLDAVAESPFRAREMLLLPMDLSRKCAGVVCDASSSCVAGACQRLDARPALASMDPKTVETPTANCHEMDLDAGTDSDADAEPAPDANADTDADAGADADADAGADADADAGAVDTDAATVVPGLLTAIWHVGAVEEVRALGRTYDEISAKNDQLRSDGWGYFVLQPYVVTDYPLYNAIWRKGVEAEHVEADISQTAFIALNNSQTSQGWRLKILEPYVDGGLLKYIAVWHPTATEAETLTVDLTPEQLEDKWNELEPGGWRLEMLKPYILGGQVLFTALWRQGTIAEDHIFAVTYTDFRAKYDAVWNQGYRVRILENYRKSSASWYSATFRPGSGYEGQRYAVSYQDFVQKEVDLAKTSVWHLTVLRSF